MLVPGGESIPAIHKGIGKVPLTVAKRNTDAGSHSLGADGREIGFLQVGMVARR